MLSEGNLESLSMFKTSCDSTSLAGLHCYTRPIRTEFAQLTGFNCHPPMSRDVETHVNWQFGDLPGIALN